jgi:hypothetical protein
MKKMILSALVIGLMTAGAVSAQNGTQKTTTPPKHKTEKVTEKTTTVKEKKAPAKEKKVAVKTETKKAGKK